VAGYQAGRGIALVSGTTEPGWLWLALNQATDQAFVAGYEWALFDYQDANGMPRTRQVS
jgi:hypothetical protein